MLEAKLQWSMALEGPARFVSYEKSRTLIYISKKVADDSAFPFAPGEELVARIDRERQQVVLERAAQGARGDVPS